jgi:DNA invertase Pin-like site-specific DNA recombinase
MKFFSDDSHLAAVEPRPVESALRNAAAYVRMSTEHQQYSTANQLDGLREYAAHHGWNIVKVYADEGRSGLSIEGRAALSQMISEVLTKKVSFAHILVYDVSRWGRFQDPDEAAHYEFICREAGVPVHYCAEPFDNNLSLASTIAKNLKRAMAGEYSRELSVKVFRGACRLVQLGYKQGGSAIYGLRRMLIDHNAQPKAILKRGEQKCLQTDRVVYVPGPEEEIKVVRWIFEAFVVEGLSAAEITRQLNARGIAGESGRPWLAGAVRDLLRHEHYIGNLVYSRTSFKLKGLRVVNPPDQWIRKENAFTEVVPRELFFKAREIFESNRRKYHPTDEYLLATMRALLAEHGRLSSELMKQLKQSPSPGTFINHFGSLVNAYRLAGFNPRLDYRHFEIARRMYQINKAMIAGIIRQIESLGATVTWNQQTRVLCLNNELRIGILFARHIVTDFGSSRWVLRWDSERWKPGHKPDLTMAVRMDHHNRDIRDYYLLPGKQYTRKKVRLAEQNGVYLDAYRFESLEFLVGMAARRPIVPRRL